MEQDFGVDAFKSDRPIWFTDIPGDPRRLARVIAIDRRLLEGVPPSDFAKETALTGALQNMNFTGGTASIRQLTDWGSDRWLAYILERLPNVPLEFIEHRASEIVCRCCHIRAA